ncbi:Beta-lactamase superfamily domain [Carpediemonas membranifera]|uniref:Beta-lactamase superfamily domain n=1 Tax=Carpediemonas membranifera TaxID=201153 RepID=A0A8J6BYT4_9EUKA|nr:Beta-lactamase superfamily domain [Carpediemonas membranifera]|eukprot:KAG9394851.1 Beta-lactamase superfamily domain [Carpediemonas membranifera]
MYLTFLGCGSYFSTFGNNNMSLEIDGHKLMIDCGYNIKEALVDANLKPEDFEAIYISHQHGDHIHGLEYMALCSKYLPGLSSAGKKIKLYLPRPLMPVVESLLQPLTYSHEGDFTVEDYFDVVLIDEAGFDWMGVHFDVEIVPHIRTPKNRSLVSYSIRFPTPSGKKVYITTDYCAEACTEDEKNRIMDNFRECDRIYHDCETSEHPSVVHTHVKTLAQYPRDIVSKLVCMHYSDPAMIKRELPGVPMVESRVRYDLNEL